MARVFTTPMPIDEAPRLEAATPDDAERVWELQRAAFAEYLGVQDPPPGVWRASAADVEGWLRSGGAVLAWLGDTLVGSIVWARRAQDLYVQHVAVHPGYRRRGIASVMMRWMDEEARRQGYARLALKIRPDLPANQALYESLGYRVTGTAPHPLRAEETLTAMEKDLPAAG
jgi:ribosomal protein S18 acetylase RimI-like enzyme